MDRTFSDTSESFAFFDNAPVLNLDIPDFDQALERAVLDENDDLAFKALTSHLEQAREVGDLERLYEMSMVLGATACMHDHMREFADGFDVMNEHESHDGHSHDEGKHDNEKEKSKKKKDKKTKRQGWFSSFAQK